MSSLSLYSLLPLVLRSVCNHTLELVGPNSSIEATELAYDAANSTDANHPVNRSEC
jgi:hypothetical protein